MKQCLFCAAHLLCNETLYQAFIVRPKYTFCATCSEKLAFMGSKRASCLRCGKQLPTQALCLDCRYWEATQAYIVEQQAVFHYNDFVADVLWQIKHNKDIHLIRGFYPAIKRILKRTYDFSTTLFIPIPTDMVSLQECRFNLIEFVFVELELPLQLVSVFVMSQEKAVKQHTLSKTQRLKTAQQRYMINELKSKILHEKTWEKIVIIDDVYTSGSTIIKAMKSLPHSVKKKVSSFTLFR